MFSSAETLEISIPYDWESRDGWKVIYGEAKRYRSISLFECILRYWSLSSSAEICIGSHCPSPTVDLVQLDVAVMDKKGNYVSGLRPWNFAVYEDGIQEKLATFGEENQAPRRATDFAPLKQHQDESMTSSPARLSSGVGRSVFILFDTSNYMYRGFVFAQDAIAEFVRSLDRSD